MTPYLESIEVDLSDVQDAACRRLVAALLLQALKDRISADAFTQHEARLFIQSDRAGELAAAIDLPWPPTEAMIDRFRCDPTLYLPAFIMAGDHQD